MFDQHQWKWFWMHFLTPVKKWCQKCILLSFDSKREFFKSCIQVMLMNENSPASFWLKNVLEIFLWKISTIYVVCVCKRTMYIQCPFSLQYVQESKPIVERTWHLLCSIFTHSGNYNFGCQYFTEKEVVVSEKRMDCVKCSSLRK